MTEAKAKKVDPVVETVTMTDGRNVDFVGKRKILKESLISADGSQVAVRIDFRNAETRTFALPASLLNKFAAHGAEQKLGDEVAGVEDVDDAVLAIDSLIDRLNKGEWSVQREAGGMSGASILLKAMVEFSGKTVEQIKEFLATKTQAEKMALKNNAKIKPIVERLTAEKEAKAASKGVVIDTDALLGELA